MKKPLALKLLALVVSIGLVGAYVAYRAVDARSSDAPPAAKAPPGETPKGLGELLNSEELFMGGSKSMPIERPAPSMDPDDEYRMRGSKSLIPFIEPKDLEPKKKDAP